MIISWKSILGMTQRAIKSCYSWTLIDSRCDLDASTCTSVVHTWTLFYFETPFKYEDWLVQAISYSMLQMA